MIQQSARVGRVVAGAIVALALASVYGPSEVAAQGAKKSDSVVKVNVTADKPGTDGKQVVTVTLTMDKGWHTYANPVGNKDLNEVQTTVTISGKNKPEAKIEYPMGVLVKDDVVGDYKVYEDKVTIKATVQRAKGDTDPLEVAVKFQACTDKQCLLPATVKVNVDPK